MENTSPNAESYQMKTNIHYAMNERLNFAQFREFLSRCDLGSQYPQEDFEVRATRLLENVSVIVIARNEADQIIGICFGLTDFAYFLLVTDLGVDRAYIGKGIGTVLLDKIHQAAGGEDNIIMYADSAATAVGFYEKYGMKQMKKMMIKDKTRFTQFTVK